MQLGTGAVLVFVLFQERKEQRGNNQYESLILTWQLRSANSLLRDIVASQRTCNYMIAIAFNIPFLAKSYAAR